jgi:hypothetical protein
VEWVLVPHPDEQGRKHGLVTYWRPDGSLVNRCEYRNGVPHGAYARYHPSGEVSRSGTFVEGKLHGVDTSYRSAAPTTEFCFDIDLPDVIVRTEVDMDRGRASGDRFYDRDGNEVTQAGEPAPARPPGVDERAVFSAEGLWFLGDRDAGPGAERKRALHRWWDRRGPGAPGVLRGRGRRGCRPAPWRRWREQPLGGGGASR